MADLTRYNKVRPPKRPRAIVMRLSSLNSLVRRDRDLNNYLLLEKPSSYGRVWTSTTRFAPAFQERMESRPPLKADLDGPTPCTYSVNIPMPTVHGTKINPKAKYNRDALPNPTTDLWTHNTSVLMKRPGPESYISPNVLGRHCPVTREAPAFSLTPRRALTVPGKIQRPAPNAYNMAKSREVTLPNYPAFTIATRTGTGKLVTTPGPAHYYPTDSLTKNHSPCFSIRQRRHSRTGTF